ncbi:MAG: helix-turn-helix domain-containing protein [Methanofollis sp.]|uniref:ArsR/SmtB family transcription factor n=1 Tax=Methanofollis sp. TaxID=2052835 RepID=UPI00261AD45A|nr:helix-turn-helix domain-containing protein [Methanofollis sp.]MDD4255861.1 helix-turn-helix domain-containing protein [Methanofollis sp.]
MTEEVVVLEPGDERAKKIAKAMASQTANDILSDLKEGPLSAAEIADHLSIPITTLKYHIENLADAGLIKIVRTKWSSKGREMKVYGLTDTLLIVAPQVKDIRAILLKYASLFGVIVFATVIAAVVMPMLMPPAPEPMPRMVAFNEGAPLGAAPKAGGEGFLGGVDTSVLAFFLGGSTVLLVLLVYEVYLYFTYYRRRKSRV